MAFKFQINNDVKFNKDEKLLKKADENIPEIIHENVKPIAIVKTTKNSSYLDGVGIEKIKDIDELPEITLGRDEKIILDFGTHYVGNFSIKADSVGSPMDAPLALKIKFAELPTELVQNSENYQGWLSKSWMQEEQLHIDVLPEMIDFKRRYSFRYVELSVIDTSPKWKVSFSNPSLVAETSASGEVRIPKLNDAELEEIYQVGVKTLADCMQDVFEDGPKRDRRLWIGDLRLQALANYSTFDNLKLIKRCLYLFGAMTAEDGRIPANVFITPEYTPDDTFLLDYGLFFVSILDDYYKETQDSEVLVDLFPIAKKQMDYVLSNYCNHGEVNFEEDYPVFVDWSNDFDKNTSGVAILIYTLKQFINLSKQLEKIDVEEYEKKLQMIVEYAKNELLDKNRGLFISGDGKEINISSQVWMVIAHVLSDEENKQLMTKTVSELFPVEGIATPYMYHHITEALFIAGLKSEAVELLKSYWGGMIRMGADTFWEAFNPNEPNYSPYGSSMVNSYCHAWSCTPVYLIDQYLK